MALRYKSITSWSNSVNCNWFLFWIPPNIECDQYNQNIVVFFCYSSRLARRNNEIAAAAAANPQNQSVPQTSSTNKWDTITMESVLVYWITEYEHSTTISGKKQTNSLKMKMKQKTLLYATQRNTTYTHPDTTITRTHRQTDRQRFIVFVVLNWNQRYYLGSLYSVVGVEEIQGEWSVARRQWYEYCPTVTEIEKSIGWMSLKP